MLARGVSSLDRRAFGFHPYWTTAGAYTTYDYSSLSTIGYFGMDVDPETGGATSMHDWRTTPVIAYAHARGVRVVLVVTNFGAAANQKILDDPAKRSALAARIADEVRNAGGDGVNIDFEGVAAAQRSGLVLFMEQLANRVRSENPVAEISMATPAVDWSGAFDLVRLAEICDYLIVMGYDICRAPQAGQGRRRPTSRLPALPSKSRQRGFPTAPGLPTVP